MQPESKRGPLSPKQAPVGGPPRRVGLVMPAFNEEAALPSVLKELPRELLDCIVVVDNNSNDRTGELGRSGGATVLFEPIQGYGQACLRGLRHLFGGAEEQGVDPPFAGSDIVVFLDADHSDYPADLPDVLAPIMAGQADMVIGSRILGGADMRALLPQAWLGNRLACFLMWLFFGARYTDLGPFRAIRADALLKLNMADRDYGWTIEMQLKAKTQGLRVVEVPVRYRPRIGTSKITGTLVGTLRAGWKIIGWILVWRVRLWLRPAASPRSQ